MSATTNQRVVAYYHGAVVSSQPVDSVDSVALVSKNKAVRFYGKNNKALETILLSKVDSISFEEDTETPQAIVDIIQQRARVIANIPWTALDTISYNTGMYQKGQQITGIPYSSTKEIDKYVGIYVLFHTFLSATKNPRSTFYKEYIKYGLNGYHGTKCNLYYGTVCSGTVNFILDRFTPNGTQDFPISPEFDFPEQQSPQHIRIGDALRCQEHVFLIYDIKKTGTQIDSVTIVESVQSGTRIKPLSYPEFVDKVIKDDYKIYRYKYLDKIKPYEEDFLNDEYNTIICPSRGDRACYRKGESVVINVLDSNYVNIRLYKEGKLTKTYMGLSNYDYTYSGLTPGKYSVIATTNDGRESAPCEFTILDVNVKATIENKVVTFSFSSSNATPSHVKFVDRNGAWKSYHVLTPEEIAAGKCVIDISDLQYNHAYTLYGKVMFYSPEGSVTNDFIKLVSAEK